MDLLKNKHKALFILILINCISLSSSNAQKADSSWTLQDCIKYALEKNISVQQTELTYMKNVFSKDYAKAERFPSLNASVGQNFGWSKPLNVNNGLVFYGNNTNSIISNNVNTEYGNYTSSNNTNYSLNTNIILFNGNKINYNVKQSDLTMQASQFDEETMKETISLNVLDAYLQVLYAEEQVKNSQKQIESTTEQLNLAAERYRLNAIAKSDYLQVKSQLASEKLTLANAKSTFAIDRLNLMQLMELPANNKFSIANPAFGDSINQKRNPDAEDVFQTSVAIKPQIKSAEIKTSVAKLGVKLAKVDYFPSLSMNAGISTGYSNLNSNLSYDNQLKNTIDPSIGLSLSIPIYQNKKVYTNVKIAEIETQNAELTLKDTKNQLRKSIEQACTDVTSAEVEYEAALEQYNSSSESYLVAKEKFEQGLINFVDFLIQKTNFISAESTLLQSKYKLIFNYKKLDFYSGKQLVL